MPGKGTTEILIKYAVQYAIKNSVISGQKPNKFLITLAKRGQQTIVLQLLRIRNFVIWVKLILARYLALALNMFPSGQKGTQNSF